MPRQPDNLPTRDNARSLAPDNGGWWREQAGTPPPQLFVDSTRSILSHHDSPDAPFSQSLNPYRGCEHGCIYCEARPAHAWLGLLPGSDFATRIFHKPHAARLLRRELGKPGYICSPIALGASTDVYQPVESALQLTRNLLLVLREHRHPLTLMTKSSLILRDLDLLAELARLGLLQVSISLTTLDEELARKLEPRAATPEARLKTIRQLSAAEIPVGVLCAPVIPGLTDQELEKLLAAARDAGASTASHRVLHLPKELLAMFDQWLSWHAPGKAARIMAILYNMRGDKVPGAHAGKRMRGLSHFSDLLDQRFRLAYQRLGFSGLPALDCSQFCPPTRSRASDKPPASQGNLF